MAIDYVKRTTIVYYKAQADAARRVQDTVSGLWGRVDLSDIDGSWSGIRGPVAQVVNAGQVRAASVPALYVRRVLEADGLEPAPAGWVPPAAFAGWTADGVELGQVLDTVPIVLKQQIGQGSSFPDAVRASDIRLRVIAATEVQDAGRGAIEAAMRLESQIVGYERYVNTPCCSRCALLAGRFYRKSAGFLRHPHCSCQHRPLTSRDGAPDQDPIELFHAMTDAQQDAAFTKDGARAIREGADIYRVVNARWQGGVRGKSAGMSRPGDPYTTVRVRGVRRRLSPQGVALRAGDDEALYVQLLRDNGYM